MKTLLVALFLASALAAQQPPFWGSNHPDDTHTHTNGNGHDPNGHNGWGYGHHNPPKPQDPPKPPKGDGGKPAQPVPEPGTLLLVGSGLAFVALAHHRRNKKPS